ncbi:MAG TPA: hypothetical protein VJU15_08420 [Gemmatimonadales bacterium]|nr:hypothetical protein [Gemmatimonadales bacterium]
MFPDALLLLRVKQAHGVFSRPAHDPENTFDRLLAQLQAHAREQYVRITDCIPDRTLQEGAVVALVCEITTKGESVLIKAGLW